MQDHSTVQLMSHFCEGIVCQGSAAQTHTSSQTSAMQRELFLISKQHAPVVRHIPFARLLFLQHGGLTALKVGVVAFSAAAGV